MALTHPDQRHRKPSPSESPASGSGPADTVESAKSDAYRLLARRPRTRKDVRTRLEQRGHPEEAVRITLNDLSELGYLDDRGFSREWCRQRMESRPLGARGLRRELVQKGVAPSIAEEVIEEIFAIENESLIARRLVRARLKKGNEITSPKDIRRMRGFLVRRGFSPDTVNRALSAAADESGETPSMEEWGEASETEDLREF